jgi:hypothetical protein
MINGDAQRFQALARYTELSEDEARCATGGADCPQYTIYYDVEKGAYIAVRQGQVFYRPGTILVC